MSMITEVIKAAPKGRPPGLFFQMKSPSMVGAYIIYHGDEGEPGPSVVLPRGRIVVLASADDIYTFALQHQLVEQDVEEMLEMHAIACGQLCDVDNGFGDRPAST